MLQKLKCLALILCALPVLWSGAAQAGTLQPSADGTVTDTATGLVWKRCLEGQAWSGQTCTTTTTYTFDQATALTGKVTFAGQNDWRLPNIRELLSIVDDTVFRPAMDKIAFPNDVGLALWSGSPSANGSNFAWSVEFLGGSSRSYVRSSSYSVRLVRGGQSLAALNVARPTADYVDNGDGTATHTPTRLMWQRCAVGQSWNGQTCVGTASTMTWDRAKTATSNLAGKTDWRLPTRQELLSLVDYTKATPLSWNATIFSTNDLGSVFWSGSPSAASSSLAWGVLFYYGYTYSHLNYDSNSVRLVRGGQSISSTATDADKVFAWAERTYTTIFSPAGQASQVIPGYRIRAYGGGHYLGVNDSGTAHLYYLGPLSNNAILDLGLLSVWVVQAGP